MAEAYTQVAQQINSGLIEEAEKSVADQSQALQGEGTLTLCQAMVAENSGEAEKALSLYEEAHQGQPNNKYVLFNFARFLDQIGDEDRALDMYLALGTQDNPPLNALFNLAVKLEENEEFDKAIQVVGSILKQRPDHSRAWRFLSNLQSSQAMLIKERSRTDEDQLGRVLEMPVSEFELSVRSRNCLKRMRIFTLGDLVRKTEQEMLSYKNFGDTSLREIKALLKIKGLYFGMRPDGGVVVPQANDPRSQPIDSLDLSTRVKRGLSQAGIYLVRELCEKSEAEIAQIKNLGESALVEIKEQLVKLNLTLIG